MENCSNESGVRSKVATEPQITAVVAR